jgi:putative ABC transport system permease protein
VNRVLWAKLRRDLLHRAGPLLVLVGVIAVGVAVFVSMASVWRDLDGARAAYYRDARVADFWVDVRRAPAAIVERVRGLPNVRGARGRVRESVMLTLPGRPQPVPGTAISMPGSRRPVLNDLHLRRGGWFSGRGGGEVILNDAFARANGLAPGDRIAMLLAGRRHEVLVVGTAMSPEFVYLIPPGGGLAPDPERFGVLYLPERFLQRASGFDGAWNELVGVFHDAGPAAVRNTLERVARTLDPYGVTFTTPGSEQASVRFLRDELEGLRIQSRVMPLLFLGVGALVLSVLMARMVASQRVIVGTLRAVGYSRAALTAHYAAHGLVVGALGAAVGIGLGIWLQRGMVALYAQFYALPDLVARPRTDLVLLGAGLSVAFALAGTVRGVLRATALEPADAMRPPPPERGGRIWPERIAPLWRLTGFRLRLVVRTVFRNPFRSGVSVLAAAIATALLFSAFSGSDALDMLMRHEFERVMHQDVTVSLRDPEAAAARRELARLPGVLAVEPQLLVAAELTRGARTKRVGVLGLAAGGRLFTPLDAGGRPVVVPERGLVLAAKLAEILDVVPGDTLRLRPLAGRRTETRALVAATVDTYLGLAAYADSRYLARLLGEHGSANALLARTAGGGVSPALVDALAERPAVIGVDERRRALRQLEETFGETMGLMVGLFVLVAGLMAAGSVLNGTLISLAERRREVGTLRVLGYAPLDVARLFVGESVALNAVGIVLGLAGGVALARALSRLYSTELYRFPAVVLPESLALTAALMALFVGLAQLAVLRAVYRLDWASVLNVKE